ncbi:hypothetical protein BAU18_000772 [Enterococcus diestrammenae]|uniref:Uncharacterized protein n=1 Tax=Enterococcus diestrammenae TaxID=1155073 RepID=A0ABV0F2E6_9ENTE
MTMFFLFKHVRSGGKCQSGNGAKKGSSLVTSGKVRYTRAIKQLSGLSADSRKEGLWKILFKSSCSFLFIP